jgi:hypothetical protein
VAALLEILDATHAFDPVALPGQRTLLYVPFEQLLAGRHESRLQNEIANTQRVALIGPIGCGKSSMVEYVLDQAGDQFAPIWVSAGHEGEETLKDPPEFARHLIREIVGWSRDAGQMTNEERRQFLLETSSTLGGRVTARKQTLSLKLAMTWIEPGWSREVEETLGDPEVERNRGDYIASLDQLVDLIHQDLGRTPVVVIDDSDRWLRLPTRDQEALLEAFFADTCRMLAERNWSIVMAVHPEYCGAPAFRAASANGYLNVQLEVPRIDQPEGIRTLLERRFDSVVTNAEEQQLLELGVDPEVLPEARGASVDDVFEAGYEALLLEYYEASDRNLRAVLTVTQQALQETINLDEAIVTNAAIRDAALSLSA